MQRDKSCYLLKIKRSLWSQKKALLEPFALSALLMKIPDCKTWRQPSLAALGITFTGEGKPGKNQAIKVSGSLAPWNMTFSVFCRRTVEETSDLCEVVGGWVGSNTHQWLNRGPQLARFTVATVCTQVCLKALCFTFWFADSGSGSSCSQLNLQQEYN